MILYMYIALGQEQTTHLDRNFDVNRNILSLLLQVKKNLLEVWFYIIVFMNLYMCIAPGQEKTTLWECNFDVNRNSLSLLLQVKKISLKSDFIQFFHGFIHVYSPGAGADNPKGTKF